MYTIFGSHDTAGPWAWMDKNEKTVYFLLFCLAWILHKSGLSPLIAALAILLPGIAFLVIQAGLFFFFLGRVDKMKNKLEHLFTQSLTLLAKDFKGRTDIFGISIAAGETYNHPFIPIGYQTLDVQIRTHDGWKPHTPSPKTLKKISKHFSSSLRFGQAHALKGFKPALIWDSTHHSRHDQMKFLFDIAHGHSPTLSTQKRTLG